MMPSPVLCQTGWRSWRGSRRLSLTLHCPDSITLPARAREAATNSPQGSHAACSLDMGYKSNYIVLNPVGPPLFCGVCPSGVYTFAAAHVTTQGLTAEERYLWTGRGPWLWHCPALPSRALVMLELTRKLYQFQSSTCQVYTMSVLYERLACSNLCIKRLQ